MNRGQGATSAQMLQAPTGALFIWVNDSSLSYAFALATHLWRGDLVVAPPRILDDGGIRLRGKRYPAIIIDHACELTHRQMDTLDQILMTVPAHKQPEKVR